MAALGQLSLDNTRVFGSDYGGVAVWVSACSGYAEHDQQQLCAG
ncbi:hypothetical protein QNM99_16870 [Pseudomonas sp. PCH446]